MARRLTTYAGGLFILLIFASFAFAATKISGVVKDAATGEPLPGANVMIVGTSIGAATDIKGEYEIPSVPPGQYEIRVTYLGYFDETQTVKVTGRNVKADFLLEYGAVYEGESVEVTAQARGQISAINQQLSSRTISNIVAADKIQEVPDANAAESVGRLPGISLVRSSGEGDKIVIRGLEPKLNLITVNGVRLPSTDENNNSVGLAGISSYMLAGIEVRKALLPDQDADAVGGTVDLKLSEAPEGFHGNVVAEGGYNGLTESLGTYKLTAQASNRFFDNKLGLYAQVNLENADRTNERMNAAYGREAARADGTIPIKLDDVSYGYNTIMRQRVGASLLGDYRLPDGKVKFSSIITRFEEDAFSRSKQISMFSNPFHRHPHNSRLTESVSMVQTIDWEQDVWGNILNIGGSYTSGHRTDPYNYNITQAWGAPEGGTVIDLAAPKYFAGPYTWPPYLNETVDYAYIHSLSSFEPEMDENTFSVYADLQVPYRFSDKINGYLKFGGKYLQKHRDYKERSRGATLVSGGWFPMSTFIEENNPGIDFSDRVYGQHLATKPILENGFSEEILDGKVLLENFIKRKYVDQIVERMDAGNWMDHPKVNNRNYQVSRDYNGEEYLSAGYIMSELNLGKKVTFIPGVRFEHEKTDYFSYGMKDLGQGEYEAIPMNSVRSNQFWLPMVHLRYKFLDWADVRLAYTHSLARPEYYHFLPRFFYNQFGDLDNAGNVNLEPAVSKNWDAHFSFYENKLGLLTLGAYYKRIEGFEHWKRIIVIDKDLDNAIHDYKYEANTTRSINIWLNNEKPAYVNGFEVDWQTNFWYMPRPLNGLILNVNYSRIFSETKYNIVELETVTPNPAQPWVKEYNRTESYEGRPLIRQPKNIMNVQVGYDIGGLSTRLAYYFQGQTLTGKGNIKEEDRYSVNYERWDLTVRYKLPVDGLQLYLSVYNITNVPDQSYQYIKKYLTSEEYYGLTSSMGLRYTF